MRQLLVTSTFGAHRPDWFDQLVKLFTCYTPTASTTRQVALLQVAMAGQLDVCRCSLLVDGCGASLHAGSCVRTMASPGDVAPSIISQWLARIGLGFAVQSFADAGVHAPDDLMKVRSRPLHGCADEVAAGNSSTTLNRHVAPCRSPRLTLRCCTCGSRPTSAGSVS